MQNVGARPARPSVRPSALSFRSFGERTSQIGLPSISLLYWSEDASAPLGPKCPTWSGIVISHLGHFNHLQNFSGHSEGNLFLFFFFFAVTITEKKATTTAFICHAAFFKGEKTDACTLRQAYIMLQKCTPDTHTHTHNSSFFNRRTMYYLCFHLGLV